MIVAAHHTMMGARPYSVEFSGEIGSNLFYQTAPQPTLYTLTGWAKFAASPTKGCMMKVGVKDTEYGSRYGGGVGLGFGQTSYAQLGNNLIVLREGIAFTSVGQISDPNTWHHYAMSVNGNVVSVYVDGASISSTNTTVRTYQTCFIYFGGFSQVARYIDGRMTRCVMWNRVLSAAEVAADYADGMKAPSVTNGLEHFWPMSSADNYLADEVGSATLTAGTGGVTISTDSPFA